MIPMCVHGKARRRTASRAPSPMVLALLALLSVLAGCTTVPTDSAPQVVRTLNRGGGSSPVPTATPDPGDVPYQVVSKFLSASARADAGHSASRQFLTTTASRKWQDTTTVVLQDAPIIGPPTFDNQGTQATVQVTASRIGQIDAAGIYTPTLKNLGVGNKENFTFHLLRLAGQWRIDQLQAGVLISHLDFANSLSTATNLYFLDSADSDPNQIPLVPDLRYSLLTGQALASWLLAQLISGPRPDLTQSVVSEVPDQVGKPTVLLGDPIAIEMPGTAQLDAAGRNSLAAQLAYTFGSFDFDSQLTITDAGRPVRIPDAGGATFKQNNFQIASSGSTTTAANSYYLRNGAVISGSDDKPVPGQLGAAGRDLSSVALHEDPAGGLQVAAVSAGRLLLGTDTKLVPVSLPVGDLSRPEWRPHGADVWVGLGTHGAVYRISEGGTYFPVSVTSPVGNGPTGQVMALRFSLDGARLAAVVRSPDGTSAAWVGSVVTSGTEVRIDSFDPITPAQLRVTDLGWATSTELSLIAGPGPATSNGAGVKVWRVRSDGSELKPDDNAGGLLANSPTAIAEHEGQPTLVSAGSLMWSRAIGSQQWAYFPFPKSQTTGSNPIYVQ